MFRHVLRTIARCTAINEPQLTKKSILLERCSINGARFFSRSGSPKSNTTFSVISSSHSGVLVNGSESLRTLSRTASTSSVAFSTQTCVQSSTSCILGRRFERVPTKATRIDSIRSFHAGGSKVHYLDFRHRFRTNCLKLHLLIIRRKKMKKHRKKKWRRKFKCLLEKRRLKREIGKEKAFRVELLTYIRRAEQFDPKEYALAKIAEINSRPREPTKEEKLEELKELIRKHRYQTDYIKPKHRRLSFYTTR